MKKAISVLLCLCLALSIFTVVPFAASAAEVTEGSVGATSGTTGSCRWSLDDEGNLTISGNGAMGNYYDDSTLPWGKNITSVIIENGVTSIGNFAFYGCTGLTSVTIPDSVTSIGSSAFRGCSGLTSITIPDSVTSIGSGAFYGTTWYNNLPNGLVYAGKFAYNYKGTMPANTSITIKDGTKGIAASALRDCTGLTSVTIPDSVTSIGEWAFYGCTRLTSVHISDIAAWCNIAFSSDGSNPLECAHNLYLKGVRVTDLIIPDGVTSIGSYAFDYCFGLTSVTIPDSVTSIGSCAFYNCTGLTSVTIGYSVTSIGNYSFYGCPVKVGLTGNCVWVLCADGALTISGNGAMEDYASSAHSPFVAGITSVVIEEGVTSIGNYAFADLPNLTSVTLPSTLTRIGDHAFENASALTAITIPAGVTEIGEDAFAGCENLTIYGYKGITAQSYANDHNIPFVALILGGDANGDNKTNVRDVTSIQRHVAEFQTLTGDQFLAADVDGNGIVDINDATYLQMYLAEYDVTLG